MSAKSRVAVAGRPPTRQRDQRSSDRRGLAALQELFQRAVIEGDDAILAELDDGAHTDSARLFGVYRHAYATRLVQFLKTDYPATAAILGDDGFDELARAFVRATPSTTPNARWYSAGLPEFLGSRSTPAVSELARIERALGDVFDGADDSALGLGDLAGLAADDWPGLVFSPRSATRRLNLETNARAIWVALNNNETPPAAATIAPSERIIVWRADLSALLRAFSYEEAMVWDELCRGVPFAGLCEMVATYGGEDEAAGRAAMHLRTFIEARLLVGPPG